MNEKNPRCVLASENYTSLSEAVRISTILLDEFNAVMEKPADTDLTLIIEQLDHLAQTLRTVDASYYAVYDPDLDCFQFVYNREGDEITEPAMFVHPKGGPTTFVVRNGCRLWVRDEATALIHHGGITFCDGEKRTESAIHFPIRDIFQRDRIIGVLSFQAWAPSVYGKGSLAIFEGLAHIMFIAANRRGAERRASEIFSDECERFRKELTLSVTIAVANTFLKHADDEAGTFEAQLQELARESACLDMSKKLTDAATDVRRARNRFANLASELVQAAAKGDEISNIRLVPKLNFSEDEVRLLRGLHKGLKNEALALSLGLSKKAIELKLKQLREKLGAGSERQKLERLATLHYFALRRARKQT